MVLLNKKGCITMQITLEVPEKLRFDKSQNEVSYTNTVSDSFNETIANLQVIDKKWTQTSFTYVTYK